MKELRLQIKINALNLEANKLYLRNGISPTQPSDTRTSAQKLADYEMLKQDVRSKLKEICDGMESEKICQIIKQAELVWLSQHIIEIIKELKPKFKYGILADIFIVYLRALITKEDLNKGVGVGGGGIPLVMPLDEIKQQYIDLHTNVATIINILQQRHHYDITVDPNNNVDHYYVVKFDITKDLQLIKGLYVSQDQCDHIALLPIEEQTKIYEMITTALKDSPKTIDVENWWDEYVLAATFTNNNGTMFLVDQLLKNVEELIQLFTPLIDNIPTLEQIKNNLDQLQPTPLPSSFIPTGGDALVIPTDGDAVAGGEPQTVAIPELQPTPLSLGGDQELEEGDIYEPKPIPEAITFNDHIWVGFTHKMQNIYKKYNRTFHIPNDALFNIGYVLHWIGDTTLILPKITLSDIDNIKGRLPEPDDVNSLDQLIGDNQTTLEVIDGNIESMFEPIHDFIQLHSDNMGSRNIFIRPTSLVFPTGGDALAGSEPQTGPEELHPDLEEQPSSSPMKDKSSFALFSEEDRYKECVTSWNSYKESLNRIVTTMANVPISTLGDNRLTSVLTTNLQKIHLILSLTPISLAVYKNKVVHKQFVWDSIGELLNKKYTIAEANTKPRHFSLTNLYNKCIKQIRKTRFNERLPIHDEIVYDIQEVVDLDEPIIQNIRHNKFFQTGDASEQDLGPSTTNTPIQSDVESDAESEAEYESELLPLLPPYPEPQPKPQPYEPPSDIPIEPTQPTPPSPEPNLPIGPPVAGRAATLYSVDFRIQRCETNHRMILESFRKSFLSSTQAPSTNERANKQSSFTKAYVLDAVKKTLATIQIAFPKLKISNFGLNPNRMLDETRSDYSLKEMLLHMNKFMEPVIQHYSTSTQPIYKLTYGKVVDVRTKKPLGAGLPLAIPTKTTTEEEIHKYEVLKGEVLAGNNNIKLIRELKKQIKKMITLNLLDLDSANSVIEDLESLGF